MVITLSGIPHLVDITCLTGSVPVRVSTVSMSDTPDTDFPPITNGMLFKTN